MRMLAYGYVVSFSLRPSYLDWLAAAAAAAAVPCLACNPFTRRCCLKHSTVIACFVPLKCTQKYSSTIERPQRLYRFTIASYNGYRVAALHQKQQQSWISCSCCCCCCRVREKKQHFMLHNIASAFTSLPSASIDVCCTALLNTALRPAHLTHTERYWMRWPVFELMWSIF